MLVKSRRGRKRREEGSMDGHGPEKRKKAEMKEMQRGKKEGVTYTEMHL